jgi:glutathione S-transferase
MVDHDPADRSGLVAVSGQPLAPVAELPDGRVVSDSPRILAELERLRPDPPLWPAGPSDRALADVLVEWFNEAWKPAPNRLAAGEGLPDDEEALRGRTARFEDLLADGRPFLLGDFGIVDVVAGPFLALCGGVPLAPDDDDPFHRVLNAVPLGGATGGGLAGVAERPRA